MVCIGGLAYQWDAFQSQKSAYYSEIAWRWGLPEGLGLLNSEARSHREVSFRILTKGGKVRQVLRENSAGMLRNDEDGVARWEVVYRTDETLDRLKFFNEKGSLVWEPVFNAKDRDIVATEHNDAAGKNQGGQQRLKLDKNGLLVELRNEDRFGIPRADARGSFGRRLLYSPSGLLTRYAEINYDGNEITLNGVRAVAITYDGGHRVIRETTVGEDGNPIDGRDGYAFHAQEYDRWGNATHRFYFRADGKPTLNADGYARRTFVYDTRGNRTEESYFGVDGQPTLSKDGYAKSTSAYDARGNEIERAFFGIDGKPVHHKDGYAGYRRTLDAAGSVTKTSYFGVGGEPTLNKEERVKFVSTRTADCASDNSDRRLTACSEIIDKAGADKEVLANAYRRRGYAYLKKGDHDRAIADYTEAIRLDPSNASAFTNRASAYDAKRDIDRAIADYTQAIKLNPSDVNAHNYRGIVYRAKGDFDRAIVDHTEAIKLNPSDVNSHNYRGIVYRAKGDFGRAIVDHTEAIRTQSVRCKRSQ